MSHLYTQKAHNRAVNRAAGRYGTSTYDANHEIGTFIGYVLTIDGKDHLIHRGWPRAPRREVRARAMAFARVARDAGKVASLRPAKSLLPDFA